MSKEITIFELKNADEDGIIISKLINGKTLETVVKDKTNSITVKAELKEELTDNMKIVEMHCINISNQIIPVFGPAGVGGNDYIKTEELLLHIVCNLINEVGKGQI